MVKKFLRSLQSTVDTNLIQASLCLFGGLCCLIPLCFRPYNELPESVLQETLSSERYKEAAIGAIALTLPIILDITVEIFTSFSIGEKSEKIKTHFKQALINKRERFVIACGILTIPITAFLPADLPNLVYIYLCLQKCRLSFVGGAIIISLCRYDNSFWTVRKTYTALILLTASTIIGSFAYNFTVVATAQNVAYALFMMGFSILFYCNVTWLHYVLPKVFRRLFLTPTRSTDETMKRSKSSVDSQMVFPVLYVATVTFASIVLTVTRRLYPETDKKNADQLFYHNLGFNLYLVFLIYISERMVKYEVVQGLYALIESKKMYVRYISHELRTPLNSAFLGLKLVCDDLAASEDGKNSEHCETLLDVQSACRTAVEILNGLLCFDKLESGILEMHKHNVPVIPFIEDCVNMFASQAKECDVAISLATGDAGSTFQQGSDCTTAVTALLQSDTVFIDKFKMDQVLRNLISNALKFTPRGGSVTVCASFIPRSNPDDSISADFLPALSNNMGSIPRGTSWGAHRLLSRWGSFRGFHRRDSLVYSIANESHHTDIESGVVLPSSSSTDMLTQQDELQRSTRRKGKAEKELLKGRDSNGLEGDPNCAPTTCPSRSSSLDSDDVIGKLRIVVTDTGAGICEEDQRRLFKEIVQFNPEVLQAGGGSGLGLWITSSIVQMHSGTISVYSAGTGMGSSFTVEIDMIRHLVSDLIVGVSPESLTDHSADHSALGTPVRCSSEDLTVLTPDYAPPNARSRSTDTSGVSTPLLVPAAPLRSNISLPRFPLKSKSPLSRQGSYSISKQSSYDVAAEHSEVYDVLVVDDSSLNRKLLCKLFRNAGYTYEEADDGLSAIDMVNKKMNGGADFKKEYDAILMDFVMPHMDGPTATEAIRGMGYTGLIFGVTGNALDSDVNHFIGCGANAVMPKPFDFLHFKMAMSKMKITESRILDTSSLQDETLINNLNNV